MGQRINTCFKASTRSDGIRQHMCVCNMRTQLQSEMKCGSATLRQNVPIFHSMCISHMTSSDIYIIMYYFF